MGRSYPLAPNKRLLLRWNRAANSTARLKNASGGNTSNYRIGQYPSANWTQQYAREALRSRPAAPNSQAGRP